jgi:hypothetical protein
VGDNVGPMSMSIRNPKLALFAQLPPLPNPWPTPTGSNSWSSSPRESAASRCWRIAPGYQGALEQAGPHFLNIEQHRNHSDSHRVALNSARTGTCGRFSIMRRIRFGFHLFAQTPELKSFYIDCFFDHLAGAGLAASLINSDMKSDS